MHDLIVGGLTTECTSSLDNPNDLSLHDADIPPNDDRAEVSDHHSTSADTDSAYACCQWKAEHTYGLCRSVHPPDVACDRDGIESRITHARGRA
jgi:hypothetical protein